MRENAAAAETERATANTLMERMRNAHPGIHGEAIASMTAKVSPPSTHKPARDPLSEDIDRWLRNAGKVVEHVRMAKGKMDAYQILEQGTTVDIRESDRTGWVTLSVKFRPDAAEVYGNASATEMNVITAGVCAVVGKELREFFGE